MTKTLYLLFILFKFLKKIFKNSPPAFLAGRVDALVRSRNLKGKQKAKHEAVFLPRISMILFACEQLLAGFHQWRYKITHIPVDRTLKEHAEVGWGDSFTYSLPEYL